MNDRDFLIWLHERLAYVHGENELRDYMHKLRAIIMATPPEQFTPNTCKFNNIDDLKNSL